MKAFLTSTLGGCRTENGTRIPIAVLPDNQMRETLKSMWPDQASVLMIAGTPTDYEMNDNLFSAYKTGFPKSGFPLSSILLCDERTPETIDMLSASNVLILMGGHVPTQHLFMEKIGLPERIKDYDGLVLTWSAGSMNCASTVYACPECDGEGTDPAYKKWFPGLGITDVQILPHFQELQYFTLDGLDLIKEIVLPDSFTHEIIALKDGSYLTTDGTTVTVYGEAYSFLNGIRRSLCENEQTVSFPERAGRIIHRIETERLILRPWSETDVDSLFEYAKDPDVGPIAGWPPHKTEEESLSIIRNVFSGPLCFAICKKGTDKAIGAVDLRINPETNQEAELGYWLGKPFWGNGYMPEAASALIDCGFRKAGLTAVWAAYFNGNKKSRRVQEKLGFVYHHTNPGASVPLLGEVRTEHFNLLTREQWSARSLT